MRFATLLSSIVSATTLVAALPSVEVVARQDSNAAAASVASAGSGCPPITPSPRCTNPTVRKEWRTLSNSQKASFLSAVKCFANIPHNHALTKTGSSPDIPPINPSSSYYDDFVYTHIDLNHNIHATGMFFPWHRLYLNEFEKVLRNKCGYTAPLPYWDWTKDASNFLHSSFWDADTNHGVGTWGTAAHDYQITDGAWGLNSGSPLYLNYPSHHAIRRNYTLQPYLNFPYPYLITNPSLHADQTFTQAVVDQSVNHFVGDFKGFQTKFQDYQGPHAGVHLIVGADLTGLCPGNAPAGCIPGETWSPNDPLFFLHHARVDKAWADWQGKNSANKCAFTGGTVQKLGSLADYQQYPLGAPPNLSLNSVMAADGILQSGIHIQDVMDTTGGYLCYTYQ